MKRIDTVLFDLDGSLLPMDQDAFVRLYMEALGRTFAPEGFDPKRLTGSVWKGVEAMIKNDGSISNRDRFWMEFSGAMEQEMAGEEARFIKFYENQFGEARTATRFSELSAKVVRLLKAKGYRVILATNPVFPSVATYRRMEWAGLVPEDFDLVTTYEKEYYCKPNLEYYRSILKRAGKEPEQCLMVGNDVDEDMCVLSLGMSGYLLTDCLINRRGKALDGFQTGSFLEFYKYVEEMAVLTQ
ncbi:MAG: HAD family hydrolase [Lachnospiraceae bacterium]|jgi:FMN phosphatase YigB (HAD superfamily)|nr:HAD family hydrolase [Lachnospiraceae bacterium]